MNISRGSGQAFFPSNSRFARFFWPFLVFVLALLPRLVGLGSRSFWLDEIFTINRASMAPWPLTLDSFQNHHMPGFFLMLAPLVHLAHPQYWMRLPSAIFGALAVMLVFMIASRIAGRLAGIFAALCLGLSPVALGFAQEARSYTLVMTLILVALYGVTRLVEDWRATKAGWVCYVLGTAGALGVLGDSLPWWGASNLIFVCLLAFVPEPRRFILRILWADAAILVITAPLYALMLHYQAQTVITSLGWIPPLSWQKVWYSFGAVYLMHVPDWVSFRLLTKHAVPGVVWLVDGLLGLALAGAVWRLRRWPAMLITQMVAFLLLPCLFVAVSLVHPVLLPRYLLWSAAPFAVLVGVGAQTWLEAWSLNARYVAALAVLALLVLNVRPYYRNEVKPNWEQAAQKLAEDVQPGDVVMFSDTGVVPILKFYLPEDRAVLTAPYTSLPEALAALKQGKRVWVVYGHAGQNSDTRTSFFAGLQALGTPRLVQKAGRRIRIVLYDSRLSLASGQ